MYSKWGMLVVKSEAASNATRVWTSLVFRCEFWVSLYKLRAQMMQDNRSKGRPVTYRQKDAKRNAIKCCATTDQLGKKHVDGEHKSKCIITTNLVYYAARVPIICGELESGMYAHAAFPFSPKAYNLRRRRCASLQQSSPQA